MPVHNAQNHLKEALASILNQTFKDYEVICIDDGSSDGSVEILKEFECENVRLITQENRGAGHSRNIGISQSRGDYVFFMDSDDYIDPEFLEKTCKNITDNSSDIVMFKIGNIKEDVKVQINPYFAFDKVIGDVDFNSFTFDYHSIKKYVMNAYFAPWAKVYKKEFLLGYDDFTFDDNLAYEDILFHIKTMLRSSRISFVPQYLYYYRLDNDSSLSSDRSSDIEIFKVIKEVEEFLINEGFLNEFEKEFEYFKVEQITYHINQIDDDYFKRAKYVLNGIDVYENPAIPKTKKDQYNVFFSSDSSEDYLKNLKIQHLKSKHEKLTKINKGLKSEHKALKMEKQKQEEIKQDLLHSNSWKMTGIFRKITAVSFKNYLLNRSDRFNYFKNKNRKLEKENRKLKKQLKSFEKQCPICGYKGSDFTPYPLVTHREVECPKCKSHERHRALWLYFKDNPQLLKKSNRLLHFAPEKTFNKLFSESDVDYHPVDISSKNPFIKEMVDIQDIPYEDDYFDVILCSHILEHVPDDRKAMRELCRVLNPGGTALILVPMNGIVHEVGDDDSKTLEDERYNTPELRTKYYGQFDHVRLYGLDFKDKLTEAGFNVKSDDYIKRLGFEKVEKYGLIKNEKIFECKKNS